MTKRTREFRKFVAYYELSYPMIAEYLGRAEQTVRRWGADVSGRPQDIPRYLLDALKEGIIDGAL